MTVSVRQVPRKMAIIEIAHSEPDHYKAAAQIFGEGYPLRTRTLFVGKADRLPDFYERLHTLKDEVR